MDVIIKVSGLKKYYKKGKKLIKAIDGVDLEIERGKFAVVEGTDGAGKTTLLKILSGLETPTEGTVRIGNTDPGKLNEEEAAVFRRRYLGFIFQDCNLIPVLSVWENIVFPLALDRRVWDEAYTMEVIRLLGLEKILDACPDSLTGSQRRIVAIARTLVSRPSVILADEPAQDLDPRTGDAVIGLLKMTGREFHQTILLTASDRKAAHMADCIFAMDKGRLLSERGRCLC